jgi:hypothetical protein
VRLRYYAPDEAETRDCTSDRRHCVDEALFTDGGVFDNIPLSTAIHFVLYDAKRPHQPLMVYIDPDLTRGRLRQTRQAGAPGASGSGIGELTALLRGAVPTARRYETQELARDLAADRRGSIHSTDRALPVLGEDLGAFGAFLGRPFREYDFYAGVYDGFSFAARHLLCHEKQDSGCTRPRLERLLADPALGLGPVGTDMARRLFTAEYDPAARVPHPADAHLGALADLVALNSALATWKNGQRCRGRSGFVASLCANGLDSLLRAFDRANDAWMQAEVSRPECAAWNYAGAAYTCAADKTLLRFARDPVRAMHQLAERTFGRLRLVEARAHSDSSGLARQMAELLEIGYQSYPARYHGGFALNSFSIPGYDHSPGANFARALPYSVSFNLASRGWDVGYRPTMKLPRLGRLYTSAGYYHASQQSKSEQHTVYAGAGFLFGANVLADFDAGGAVFHSFENHAWYPAGTAGASLLGNKLRLGLRVLGYDKKPHAAVNMGVGDANGVFYWLLRHAFQS